MIKLKATFLVLLLAGSLSASVAYLVGIETGNCRLVSYRAGSESNLTSDTVPRRRVQESAGQR
jgi:hypothetical protein